MKFSGKRFRRTRCENIDEMLASIKDVSENIVHNMLQSKAPVVCYTDVGSNSIKLELDFDGQNVFTQVFPLGEEQEMEKRDGTKVKMTYSLQSENVLKQVVKMPGGKTACFIREFKDNDFKMTVSVEGTDIKAVIYYEVINTIDTVLDNCRYY